MKARSFPSNIEGKIIPNVLSKGRYNVIMVHAYNEAKRTEERDDAIFDARPTITDLSRRTSACDGRASRRLISVHLLSMQKSEARQRKSNAMDGEMDHVHRKQPAIKAEESGMDRWSRGRKEEIEPLSFFPLKSESVRGRALQLRPSSLAPTRTTPTVGSRDNVVRLDLPCARIMNREGEMQGAG